MENRENGQRRNMTQQQPEPWLTTVLSASAKETAHLPWNGYEEMRAAQAQYTWKARQPELDALQKRAATYWDMVGEAESKRQAKEYECDQLRAPVARLREHLAALLTWIETLYVLPPTEPIATLHRNARVALTETEAKP